MYISDVYFNLVQTSKNKITKDKVNSNPHSGKKNLNMSSQMLLKNKIYNKLDQRLPLKQYKPQVIII